MTIAQTEIVDILYKKLQGVSKTDLSTAKSPANEGNASPQLSPGSTIWQQDYLIPAVTTLPTSNSSVVTVYRQSLSSTAQAIALSESKSQETWATNLTNWIPPQYGAGYQLKLYAGPPGSSTPENFTNLPVGGSGNNDSWYFDYSAGIVNFADTNVPTAVANVANVVYVEGARYTGQTGITSFVGTTAFANITVSNSATVGGITTITSSAQNTGINTGALQVTQGGAYIAGNLYVGGNINLSQANVAVFYGNSGVFYGNTAGDGALYAGIVSGYLAEPLATIQSTANQNNYAGILNGQNINSGSQASTDIFLSPNNGTYNDTYVDLGVASSTYNYPGFGIIKPNDAYLYNQGNATTGGGNLILGTGAVNDIVFVVQGLNANNEVMRITSANVVAIKSTIAATSTTSGALTIAGGAGISGNLYVGSNVNIAGTETVGNIVTTNGLFWANGVNALAPSYGNTQVAAYLLTNTGNISSGNIAVTGNAVITGTETVGNLITTSGVFWANGVSFAPVTYSNANVATYLPTYSGNLYPGNVTSTFYGSIHTDYILTNTTGVVSMAINSALGLPTGGNSARPSSPQAGQFRYNSDISTIEFYNGAGWVNLSSAITGQDFYGDGASTQFTLNSATTATGILVSINGVVQQPGVAYTVSGNQIIFTEIPQVTDLIDVRFLASAVTNNFNDVVVNASLIPVSTANIILDSFDATLYRSAKYTISGTTHMAEVQILQNSGVVLLNAYGVLNTDSNTINYYANINGSTVNLLAQGTTSSNVRIQSTYFTI